MSFSLFLKRKFPVACTSPYTLPVKGNKAKKMPSLVWRSVVLVCSMMRMTTSSWLIHSCILRIALSGFDQWILFLYLPQAQSCWAVALEWAKNSVLNRARQGLRLGLTYSNSLATGNHRGSHRELPLGPPLGGRMPRASDLARSPLCFVHFLVPLSYHCPCILGMVYRATLKYECRDEEGLYPLKLPSFVWKRQERQNELKPSSQWSVRHLVWIKQIGSVFKVFNLHFS